MEWLIAAGHHPRATATTLRIAHDLADRMDYDTGHVRYCMEETAARLGIDKSTVKRHIAVLRELGALAWLVHGTKANIRRRLGLGGYAATATVYAAVIPAAYDQAMGHQIIGSGYTARIVVDQRGRGPAHNRVMASLPDQPEPVDNSPVDNPGSGSCAPPSLSLVKEEGKLKVESGFNYTSRKRASRPTESLPQLQTEKRSSSSQGCTSRRRPMQVAQDIRIARRVRALVNWTQAEGLRRLAYVLRPFIDRGLDADAIASDLHGMCLGWKPMAPANYIRAALIQQAAHQAQLAAAEARGDHLDPEAWMDVQAGPQSAEARTAWQQATERTQAQQAEDCLEVETGQHPALEDLPRHVVVDMRRDALKDPGLILSFIATAGEADARRLYTNALVNQALGSTSPTLTINPWREASYA